MQYQQDKIWLAMADACFDGTGMSVLERFQWAQQHDCMSIEGGEAAINDPQAYLDAIAQTGLFVHGINVWVAGDAYFQRAITCAKTLGATYITHQVPRQPDRETGLAFLKHHQALCHEAGLNYLFETHRWTASEYLDDTKYYLQHLPGLDILSDLSHYIPLLYERPDFAFLHPRTKAMHLRVAMANNVQVEIGEEMNHEGCQLFVSLWQDILKAGFCGPVVGEIIPFYLTYPRYDATRDNANALKLFTNTVITSGYTDRLLLPSQMTQSEV